MVPSSPYEPWSTGKTTSTSVSARPTAAPGSRTASPRPSGSPTSDTAVPPVTSGSRPSVIASCWRSSASTQRPSVAMPTGTTSYRSGSRAAITLPADTQEIACSALRPPKTTATRTLPACPLITTDPSRATPQPPGGGADPAVAAAGFSVWEPRRGEDPAAPPGAPPTTPPRRPPGAPRHDPSRRPPVARAPLGAPAGWCGRPPLHGQRLGPRAADRDRRPGGEGGHRPLAGPGDPVHRRDRRDARPPLPGEGDAPLVRRRPSRRHRRLPDLRVRPRRSAVDDRPAALRRARVGAGGIAAAGLQLPVLPGGREDRRPLLPRLPELLEHRRL